MSDMIQDKQGFNSNGAAQYSNQYCAAPNYYDNHVDPLIYNDVSPFNENATDYRFFCAKTGKGRAIWGAIYPFLIFIAAEFVSIFAILMAFIAVGKYNMYNLMDEVMSDLMLIELLSQIITAIIVIPIYLYQKKHSFPQTIYENNTTKWTAFLLGGLGAVCVAFALDLIGSIASLFVQFDSSTSDAISEAIMNSDLLLAVLTTAILAPIIEEVLFRGLILEKLSHAFSAKTAIIVSAIAFGVAHGNLEQGIFAACFGVALGYVYVKTRSIIPGIIAHFVNNFVATILTSLEAPDIVQLGVIGVIAAVCVVCLVKFIKLDDVRVIRNKKLVDTANALYATRFNMIYGNAYQLQVPQYAAQPYVNPSNYSYSANIPVYVQPVQPGQPMQPMQPMQPASSQSIQQPVPPLRYTPSTTVSSAPVAPPMADYSPSQINEEPTSSFYDYKGDICSDDDYNERTVVGK